MKIYFHIRSRFVKLRLPRFWKPAQYEQLMDAVYLRRGWNGNSVPTLKELGLDLPEVVDVVEGRGIVEMSR